MSGRALRRGAAVLAGLPIGLALALWAGTAAAQEINLDFGAGGSSTDLIVQLVALVTILSLAPSILVMITSFTRIVVVLSFLRTAMGVQQTPPNNVLISLALFLTAFVMAPVFQQSWDQGLRPLIDQELEIDEAFPLAAAPFRDFMLSHVREEDLRLFMDMGEVEAAEPTDVPLHVLIPAFMISELRRAFEIGFLLFLPFVVIDMVVASILMSMGMMMLPPIMISLPFKVVFFVLVDGWYMVAGSLVQSYGPTTAF